MLATIYVPLDNSEHSNAAAEVAVGLAHAFGGRIVGSHVYAARMHDYRFKQMEYTLPEEYQDEQELEHQRAIHDTLITRGLRLISDSYTDVLQGRCAAEGIAFEPRTMDGRNWEQLVEDINGHDYDLVVMGAQGFGATGEAQLGSVCERVVRRTRTDTLIVKEPRAWTNRPEGSVAVCIDGSPQSFGGLRLALGLGRALGRPVEAVAAYDPYLHYAMFNGIVGVLSQEASKVFRFKEQEQLHEEIIDTGLAKIYESHLQVARRVAEQEGVDLKVTLLDGKAWERVVHWARKERPWLLVMGRIGVHSDEAMDIGSNSEHMLRAVGCNVLLVSSTYVPPVDVRAEEVMVWTPEANRRMERVPQFVRGVARTAIHRWALQRGTSVISSDIIDEACMDILPPSAAQAMGIMARRVAVEHELAPRAGGGNAHAGKTYICGECGYAARDVLPVVCPVCRSGPERFAIIDHAAIERAASRQGTITEEEAFDGKKVAWTDEARRLLFSLADAYARRRAKARIEKLARTRRLPAVTVEFASPVIQEMLGDLARLHANGREGAAAGPHPRPLSRGERGGGGARGERGGAAAAERAPGAAAPDGPITVEARPAPALTVESATSVEGAEAAETGAEPPWTAEALRRLERVPAGYMRDMTRDLVLRHAADVAAAAVTLEVCEGGIAVAKREMAAMIAARTGGPDPRAVMHPPNTTQIHTEDTEDAVVHRGGGCPVAGGPHPRPLSHGERGEGDAQIEGTHWPATVGALNEIKPAFIARLARYYAPGTAGRRAPATLDFVWSPEAERLLAAVPAYCRELARWRVEWTAYKLQLGRLITRDAWEREQADWSELADHLRPERLRRLAWAAGARARLAAVPSFVREQVALALEINAAHLGHAAVTEEAFDAVARRWEEETQVAAQLPSPRGLRPPSPRGRGAGGEVRRPTEKRE